MTFELMMNPSEHGIVLKKSFEHSIVILDAIESGNNKKPFRERLDYKEFYNETINKDVNLS
jgi:hypothetical protein